MEPKEFQFLPTLHYSITPSVKIIGGGGMIGDLVRKTRSYRRFFGDQAIPMETLRSLVQLARLSASAANRQPLKYILSNDKERNAIIFPKLAWAAYLKDCDGPEEGERPLDEIIIE